MGRPRLYNTPEEKKAAKATNSKRSYARFAIYSVPAILKLFPDTEITSTSSDGGNIPVFLENMFIINVRNIEAETKEPVQVTTQSILESRMALCLERSKNIRSRLGKICGPDEIAYLNNLCTAFVKENNKDIELHISSFKHRYKSTRMRLYHY
jgi:hypothetical protein